MKSRFHIKGHPIHTLLVPFPIVLYLFSLVCDILFVWKGGPIWYQMAFWVMLFGVMANLAANLSGIPDFLVLRKESPSATKTALAHLILGWTLIIVYGLSLSLRNWGLALHGSANPIAFFLNVAGAVGIGLQGWFGGELVYRFGIGVQEKNK